MTDNTEQRLAFLFGVLGGVLIALAGLVSLAVGMSDMILGRSVAAVAAGSGAVILFVIGGLSAFFAWNGRHEWSGRPLTSGILLLVLALVAWLVMGIGGNVLTLIGALFVFLSAVLFLIEPAKKVVGAATAAS